eukprot:m.26453 g.26453  ORF g.26453 m.26453 type:complete len:646 (+) comp7799_c0_seq1:131-2068(+)
MSIASSGQVHRDKTMVVILSWFVVFAAAETSTTTTSMPSIDLDQSCDSYGWGLATRGCGPMLPDTTPSKICACSDKCMSCNRLANFSLVQTSTFVSRITMREDQTVLILQKNGIPGFTSGVFDAFTTLTVLGLNNNLLTTLPHGIFKKNTALEAIYLYSNLITSLPTNIFETNAALLIVDLSHNLLQKLPLFPLARNLSTAFFDANRFDNLGGVQQGMDSILYNNTFFDRNDGNKGIPMFSISKNPVSCLWNVDTYAGYVCECSIAYESKNGHCKLPEAPTRLPEILGGTFGGIVVGLALAVIIFYVHKELTSLKENLGLHELLLEEQTTQVKELLGAWDISAQDVKLISLVDEGAFGEVYHAEWDGIVVAVKRIRKDLFEMDELASSDFENEVGFLRKCRHRNTVRFFGAGKFDDGLPFLVTEYMAGGSLAAYLKDVSVTWPQKMSFCLDIQAGMQYIHTLGRVHRDLKTANILLSPSLRAKVADFGSMKDIFKIRENIDVSKMQNTSLSSIESYSTIQNKGSLTQGVGTPMYMAPEVMRTVEYGPSADVWSFGIILWEIATQEIPSLELLNEKPPNGPILPWLEKVLTKGNRLPLKDDNWPNGYANVVARCQELVPSVRPTFGELGDILEAISDSCKPADVQK